MKKITQPMRERAFIPQLLLFDSKMPIKSKMAYAIHSCYSTERENGKYSLNIKNPNGESEEFILEIRGKKLTAPVSIITNNKLSDIARLLAFFDEVEVSLSNEDIAKILNCTSEDILVARKKLK